MNEGEAQEKNEVRLIKRYSNRKLYDTERSRYVTLDEIASMIKAGDDLKIIDNKTKEDLTTVTLTQIIFEEEKRESRLSISMLRSLIQTGGATLQDFFDRSLKNPVVEIRDSAQKSVEELRQGALQLKDAATRQVTELTGSARRIFSREERRAEDFRRGIQLLIEALEERLDQRVAFLESEDQVVPESPQAPEPKDKDPHCIEAHVTYLREAFASLGKKVETLEGFKAPASPNRP